MIAVVVVKDRMVVIRLFSQTVSRILAELEVLSMGIIHKQISSFQNIYLINFCGFTDPENFLTTIHFQTTIHYPPIITS